MKKTNDFSYRWVTIVAVVYLLGCLGGNNSDPDPDRDLDEAEAERFGCPGAYVYDWKRNCRYESKKLCDLEFVACQETETRNAYDVDGTCWRFNTCIPDANYWPAEDADVCNHSRSQITFCDDADVECENVETKEQCELAAQCQPALGYEWDPVELCALEGFEPRFLGCVPRTDECDVLELKKLGDGCILTSVCAEPSCPGGDCTGCEAPETFRGCNEWRSQMQIVTFDPEASAGPVPIEFAAEPGERPAPCVAASLGEAKFRSGSMFYDQPAADSSRWELMIPVRNVVDSSTCGFEGAPLRLSVTETGGPTVETVAYWPAGVSCNENTWIQVVLEPAPNVSSYDVRLSAVDSCGTGGGAITKEVRVE